MPETELRHWYAVQTKRCEEHRVVQHLELKRVATFLPLIESPPRHPRARVRTHLEPLFPGYLFVEMRPVETDPGDWQVVRWTPGVRRIVGTADIPVPVPVEAMEAIRARVAELGFVRPGQRFSAGTRVRVRVGPLSGLEGVFDRPMSRRGRVQVLLWLLGQMRRVEADELALESA
jgi:transcription elongation factor/antiterminator RfaH